MKSFFMRLLLLGALGLPCGAWGWAHVEDFEKPLAGKPYLIYSVLRREPVKVCLEEVPAEQESKYKKRVQAAWEKWNTRTARYFPADAGLRAAREALAVFPPLQFTCKEADISVRFQSTQQIRQVRGGRSRGYFNRLTRRIVALLPEEPSADLILQHELGHALGLADQYPRVAADSAFEYASPEERESIMQAAGGGWMDPKQFISCDDADGLLTLAERTGLVAFPSRPWPSACPERSYSYLRGRIVYPTYPDAAYSRYIVLGGARVEYRLASAAPVEKEPFIRPQDIWYKNIPARWSRRGIVVAEGKKTRAILLVRPSAGTELADGRPRVIARYLMKRTGPREVSIEKAWHHPKDGEGKRLIRFHFLQDGSTRFDVRDLAAPDQIYTAQYNPAGALTRQWGQYQELGRIKWDFWTKRVPLQSIKAPQAQALKRRAMPPAGDMEFLWNEARRFGKF